jgi:hypothetical protein
MKHVVLISCVSKKLPYKAQAKDLYTSPLFTYAFRYAFQLKPDMIFILSAKYGLLNLEEVIDPYDQTLNTMTTQDAREWAKGVLEKLSLKTDINQTTFTFLAGEKYRRFLIPELRHFSIPLEGLSIGRQLQRLKQLTES